MTNQDKSLAEQLGEDNLQGEDFTWTALQEANYQLQRRVDELLALNRITQAVTMIANLQTVLYTVAEEMANLFGAFSASISLYDLEQMQRKIVTMYDPYHPERAGLVGYTISLQDDPLNLELLETRQSIIVPQPQTHPLTIAYHHIMQTRNVVSLMLVPLLSRAEVIGNIGLSSREPGREFTPAEARLAETIAGQIAGAIEMARLFDEARRAREAAERANQAKTDFLANISHELRTPLHGILGYTQMLRRDPTLTHHHDDLKIIQQNGEYLLTLLNDILDLSKIEAGKMELYPEEFHLGYFLESIVDIFRLQAQQKGLAFIYEASPGLPIAVRGDEKRLRQVLINLLGNAVKFTERGQVSFTVSPIPAPEKDGSSALAGEPEPGYVSSLCIRFQVQDTGPGINLEDLEKIFAPFQRVVPYSDQVAGTGLGLSISRRLVDAMGGTLGLESRPNEGATFWMEVDLPVTKGWVQLPVQHLVAGEREGEEPPAFVGPSPGEAAVLLSLAKIGDINGIEERAASLEQSDEQYRPFAAELQRLAKQFRIEKIQELLKIYLENKPED